MGGEETPPGPGEKSGFGGCFFPSVLKNWGNLSVIFSDVFPGGTGCFVWFLFKLFRCFKAFRLLGEAALEIF